MHPEDEVSDEEIIKWYKEYYGDDKYLAKEQVAEVRRQGFRASQLWDHRLQGVCGRSGGGVCYEAAWGMNDAYCLTILAFCDMSSVHDQDVRK
jgi:hypothetical protein